MRSALKYVVWVALLAVALLPTARAQMPGQAQQPPPKPPAQPGQAAQPAQPAAPAVNPEEDAAYKAFAEVSSMEIDRQIALGEDFLKKYPESRYREALYAILVRDYYQKQQLDKMMDAGEKALELNPDNIAVLPWLAMVPPRVANPNDLDGEQKLQKAESHAKHGIELLTSLAKPADRTEEEFAKSKNEALMMCHSGLGVVYFRRGRYQEAAAEMDQATELVPDPDPTDLYILGLSRLQTKQSAEAAAAFEKCGQIQGSLQARCKQYMEQAKKAAAAAPAAPKP